MKTKICSICKIEKPISEFNKHSACKFGVRPQCKECHSSQSVKWQKDNYEHRKEYLLKWRSENKEKVKAQREKYKSIKNKKRREKYATDEAYKKKVKLQVAKYHKKNPNAKLKSRFNKYGITIDDYNNMLKKQNFGCAICGAKNSGDSKKERLHVDHCHRTGIVRGLLCSSCNMGLGKFKDDVILLKNAIEYLKVKK